MNVERKVIQQDEPRVSTELNLFKMFIEFYCA